VSEETRLSTEEVWLETLPAPYRVRRPLSVVLDHWDDGTWVAEWRMSGGLYGEGRDRESALRALASVVTVSAELLKEKLDAGGRFAGAVREQWRAIQNHVVFPSEEA
jgi:predicted RNase H-like HicB family nuclease